MRQTDVDIEQLYDLYHLDVYHFALYFTNNAQEAEDILQETFLKVLQQIHKLRKIEKTNTWILSIARNTAVDRYRRKKIRSLLPEKIRNEKKEEFTKQPQEVIEFHEEWQVAQHALMSLKSHDRTIIIYRMLKDLSIQEIAEILNCSEVKVRVDFHRAMKRLRKKVGRDE